MSRLEGVVRYATVSLEKQKHPKLRKNLQERTSMRERPL
jgi:hypothetical protein